MKTPEYRPSEKELEGMDHNYFGDVVSKAIEEGRATINRDISSTWHHLPEEAIKEQEGVTDSEIIEAVRKIDFTKVDVNFTKPFGDGKYHSYSSRREESSDGTQRTVFLTLKQDTRRDIQIKANVDLVHYKGQEPELKITVFPIRIDTYNFGRSPEDGQCLSCYGNGCWECSYSGGY